MKASDTIYETYLALSSNKVRSGLTMLGIVIGIASVIAMVAIGQGAQASITSSIQSIGSNLIMVMPGTQQGPGTQISGGQGSARSLTTEDADAIAEKISSVKAVAPDVSGRYQVAAKGTNTNTSVVGTTSDYSDVRNLKIADGIFITNQHIKNISKVAVIGPTVVEDLFTDTSTSVVGKSIRIKGIEFKVIGVTQAKGGSGFGSQDDMVFVPLSSAQKFLSGNDYLSTISIQAESADVMTQIQQDVTQLLLERHKIKSAQSADFRILNQEDIVNTASSITQTLTILLGAVAGISLVVGGIGIMNMMLTTVTERTREIGLRKAIGAKRKDINTQFLIEAIVLTFVGGAVGIILGSLGSYAINYFGLLQTSVSLYPILLAFGVSAAIGIVFGYYPARRASRLNPIEALRYE